LFCSSCGHDNPRENRYCGMCGSPFAHRFLPVPKEQSALTFPIAPIEIAPSELPVVAAETFMAGPPQTSTPVEPAQPGTTLSAPTVEMSVVESESVVEVEAPPPPVEVLSPEPVPVAEFAEVATAAETIPVEVSELGPPPMHEVFVPEPEEIRPSLTESPTSPVEAPPEVPVPSTVAELAPTPVSYEEVPPRTPLPEIRRYATPHLEAPPAHVEAATPKPSGLPRPPAPQSLEPPPDSAGMPTFQAVVEASGAPPISPFEPPVAKDTDEERELQEYIASFRYHPPEEAVDELTMRSEVPVLDAEAPVTPSHPSFDDDVPPPPEAGPHPTGEEYYPAAHASADRSGYLDVGDTHRVGSARNTVAGIGGSILGLDAASSDSAPPPDEFAPPVNRHWALWLSVAVLVAIFGTLGFFEGRAQRNHAYQGPIELIQEQYAKLRQRVSEMSASAPASDKPVAEAPAKAEPQTKPAATDEPAKTTTQTPPESPSNQNPAASPVSQQTASPDQQQPKATSTAAQTTPMPENKPAALTPAASVTPQKPAVIAEPKPAPETPAAKRESAIEPPAAVAKPKSKPDPGQEELAKAMQASDPAAAAAWLWKATSRGNSVAPVRLADMYIKGKGVPHSCEQALVLLRSEAAKENAPARNRLAALYANGTCVARDRVKAYQLMSSALAVDPGSEWAEQNRKELWQQMTPAERSQVEKYR
jgi:hypothetical protein